MYLSGIVDTDMYKKFLKGIRESDALHKHLMQSHPLGRIGKPEDIAYGALFLASSKLIGSQGYITN